MTTTDTIPADARTLPDDTERQKHIASLVFDMDDELGQTKRLIEGAMLSLEAVTMRPIEKLRAKEIFALMDAVSTVLEAALDHHGILHDQWRTLFDLIRKDASHV